MSRITRKGRLKAGSHVVFPLDVPAEQLYGIIGRVTWGKAGNIDPADNLAVTLKLGGLTFTFDDPYPQATQTFELPRIVPPGIWELGIVNNGLGDVRYELDVAAG